MKIDQQPMLIIPTDMFAVDSIMLPFFVTLLTIFTIMFSFLLRRRLHCVVLIGIIMMRLISNKLSGKQSLYAVSFVLNKFNIPVSALVNDLTIYRELKYANTNAAAKKTYLLVIKSLVRQLLIKKSL